MENTTPVKKKWKTWQKILVGIVVLIIIVNIASPKKDKVSDTASGTAEPAALAAEPVAISVTASQLFKDYKANEVSADAKYKGKMLQVSGTVESINKDFTDDIYVNLHVSDFENVKCDLSKEAAGQAANLKKGQRITVMGEGGTMIIGTPIIENCVIK